MLDNVQGNEGGKSYAVAQGSADKQKKKVCCPIAYLSFKKY